MSDKPKLQNIPLRTELGKQVHEAFTKHLHIDVDYEALEKRMAAEAVCDAHLVRAAREGTSREVAKMLNFMDSYGSSVPRMRSFVEINHDTLEQQRVTRLELTDEQLAEFVPLHGAGKPVVGIDFASTIDTTAYVVLEGDCRTVIGLDGIRDTFKICVQQLRDTKGTHDATVHRKAVIELSKFILAAEGRASRVDAAMGGREKRYDAAWSRWNHQSCYHHLPPNSWEHLHAVRWANRRANERSDFIWSNV